jgi:hypothetical protein
VGVVSCLNEIRLPNCIPNNCVTCIRKRCVPESAMVMLPDYRFITLSLHNGAIIALRDVRMLAYWNVCLVWCLYRLCSLRHTLSPKLAPNACEDRPRENMPTPQHVARSFPQLTAMEELKDDLREDRSILRIATVRDTRSLTWIAATATPCVHPTTRAHVLIDI